MTPELYPRHIAETNQRNETQKSKKLTNPIKFKKNLLLGKDTELNHNRIKNLTRAKTKDNHKIIITLKI